MRNEAFLMADTSHGRVNQGLEGACAPSPHLRGFSFLSLGQLYNIKYQSQTPLSQIPRGLIMFAGSMETFYLTTHSTRFIYGYMSSEYGKGPFRWRERKPAVTTSWATLSDYQQGGF